MLFLKPSINPQLFVRLVVGLRLSLAARPTVANKAATLLAHDQIFALVRMTRRAMRFLSVRRCGRVSTQNIGARGNGFEVMRVYAKGISAKMIKLQSLWDWAIKKFITKAVSVKALPSGLHNMIDAIINGRELWIAHALRALPCPAIFRYLYMQHKQWAVLGEKCFSHSRIYINCLEGFRK